MADSLKNKTVKGVAWSLTDNLANQGITFLVGLVLARLLTPTEYGVIGIIMIFIAVFNSIVDSGFSSALIRKTNATHTDYNTVFLFNIVLSIVLYVAIYIVAPAIAHFFNNDSLIILTRVMGIVVIINGLGLIQKTILTKNIDFKTQTKISCISSITSGIVGIVMAVKGFGVWSLVAQQISRQILFTIFLWIYSREWFPRFEFSMQSFKQLFSFGSKILVVGLIHTIWEEIYQFVIGKCYSPATLGQFTRANQFRTIFSRNFASVIQRVSYPVLSSIENDPERLRQGFRRIVKVTTLIAFTCMLGLGAASYQVILVLIGEKWLIAASFLQIICFSGMLNPQQMLNNNLLQVQGKSGLLLRLEIVKRIFAAIPVLFGIFISIEWMLWGRVFTNLLCLCLSGFYAGKAIHYSLSDQFKDVLPAFLIALFMGGVVWAISFISWTNYILLPVQIISGGIVVVSLCELFKLEEYYEIKHIALSLKEKISYGK